ncbi:MAG: hypothetical protein K6F69_04375 [Treponema sp.]|nr:hypothetical protein [Treponema sp.]
MTTTKKTTVKGLFVTFLTSIAILFTSCQGVIFYEINKEVELNSAQIEGDVNSLVRFGDQLITQNGYVWYKDSSSSTNGEWTKVSASTIDDSKPSIIKVAADSSYIYAFGITYDEDTESGSDTEGENIISSRIIYCATSADGEWTAIDTSSIGDDYYPECLFCTNAEDESGRYAYVRMSDGNTYQLDGTSAPTVLTDGTNGLDIDAVTSAVYFNSEVWFSNYPLAANDTYMYWTAGSDTVYYGTDTTSATGYKDVSCDDILSMAVTSDYLLLGTESGIEHVAIDSDGAITSTTSDFDTNADSVLSSYYYVPLVFSLDSSLSEEANTLYGSTVYYGSASASASYYDNICLWAYYPSRGNWNCE